MKSLWGKSSTLLLVHRVPAHSAAGVYVEVRRRNPILHWHETDAAPGWHHQPRVFYALTTGGLHTLNVRRRGLDRVSPPEACAFSLYSARSSTEPGTS